MKKIIIVASHFPPSNLAAVHRARLFAMHLPKFGWEPIIVTVHHRFYEEELDWNLEKLLDPNLRVEKVKALPVKPFRLIGDIGIRAFLPMLFRILNIIKKEKIDFLYITIPSFYSALLGRIVYMASKTKYGIDYIDPWVHDFPGSNKILSKARFSKLISKILEPIAVRKASLITGIAPKYYLDVFKRNPRLKNFCLSLAMPYGGERTDFEAVTKLNLKPYLFEKTGKIDLVYAGAMLPKAHEPLRAICEAISDNRNLYTNVRFHFIGTGTWLGSENKYNIKPLAKKFGIWQEIIFEYSQRIPYLDVLAHLKYADGIFILGSTEAHYTPSKVYQAVLSKRPICAVLHQGSVANEFIRSSNAGMVLNFDSQNETNTIRKEFNNYFSRFLEYRKHFVSENAKKDVVKQYSAFSVTKSLAQVLDKIAR